MAEWAELLRASRTAIGLSRKSLAQRAGVSPQTVKAYELGLRRPSRSLLTSLLDELRVDRGVRGTILEGAGFSSDSPELGPDGEYWYALDDAKKVIDARPWPAHINSELVEVLHANRLMQKVWDVNLATDFTGPLERNMFLFASTPRFSDRITNWDEMLSVGIGVLKGHHRGAETEPEGTSAYFSAVMERFLAGDPAYVQRFIGLWENVEPQLPKISYSYPVIWQHLSVGTLRFETVVTTANDIDGFTFIDWIPTDAETWERLGQLA